MKSIITRILLSLTFILAAHVAKAQTIAGSTACPGSVLTLTSTPQPINIVWQQAGVGISTVTPTYASSATTVAGTGTSGSGTNQFSSPTGVYVDAGGNIYVSDQSNHRIQKWAPGATSGTTVAGTGTAGSGANQLSAPDGVYVDAGGNIYVADQNNNRIQKWAPGATSGTTVAGTGTAGNAANQLSIPHGVYVDASGNIYVADYANNRIQKWAPGATSGTMVAGTGTSGSGANQLSTPFGVYVDAGGNIYVADQGNHRIQKWAPGATSGTTVAGTGTSGSGANQLNQPIGVYVDAGGNIYVADRSNNRIQKWAQSATSGTTVAGTGTSGSGANQLNQPFGVYMDAGGNIYVADLGNSRIQKFVASIVNTYTAAAAGNYAALVTTQVGAVTTNTVTVYALPNAGSISGASSVCAGVTFTFSTTGSGGTWSSSNAGVATVGSTGVVSGVSAGTTIISYTVTNSCGSSSGTYTVSISALPTIGVWGNTIIYAGSSTSLTANGGVNYTWSPGTGLSATTGATISANPSTVTDYTVTGTNICGGSNTALVTVSVVPVPTIAGSTACPGSVLTLTSTPQPINIVWQQAGVGISTVTPTYASSATTVAGTGTAGSGTNQLRNPTGVYVDASGNIYVADQNNNRIQKWAPGATSGTTVAGTGTAGSGANQLSAPFGVYVDAGGNIFVADYSNHRIQKWAPGATSGTTVAGTGTAGSSPNQLWYPRGVYVDAGGNIYVADYNNNRIQKWVPGATSGTTVAGITGTSGSAANQLFAPYGVYMDAGGNIYVADDGNNRIQKWAPGAASGTTIAGTGTAGSAANQLDGPFGVYVDAGGNIYVVDRANHRIQKWAPGATSGTTVAGTGTFGTATNQLNYPAGVFVDAGGNIYVADASNHRIQKFAASIVNTYTAATAGSYAALVTTQVGAVTTNTVTVYALPNAGSISGASSITSGGTTTLTDGVSGGVWSSSNTSVATIGSTGLVTGVSNGTAIISYGVTNGCGTAYATLLVRVSCPLGSPGTIITVAGNGTAGYIGDGMQATASELNYPNGIAADAYGNVYISDVSNIRIRKVDALGVISTIGGNGIGGYSGDGGPATSAKLNGSRGIVVDAAGNVYFPDLGNHVVRKISSTGIMSTVAGNGTAGYSGDGGAATSASLNLPAGIALDASGNIFIADENNSIVRKVNASGVISTVAGNGTNGYSGDGGIATNASLNFQFGNIASVAVDGSGNIYISDINNNVVRKVNPAGIISNFAGNGTIGSSGDGGPATLAKLSGVAGLAVDGAGNLYIGSSYSATKVRMVNSSGIITTVAGNGTSGFSGDGGAATNAVLNAPISVAVNSLGDLYIADYGNVRIRKVSPVFSAISGTSSLCSGSNTTLSDATTGGTWSSSNTSVATIGSTGIVNGVSAGTSIISYITPCGSTSMVITINPLPNAGTISGPSSVCTGSSIGLSESATGGSWSSASANLSVSGSTITGVTAGTATISYTVTNGCGSSSATTIITINPLPNAGTITGLSSVCVGSTIGLSDAATGGTWSSASANVSVSGSTVTGVTAGTAIISYTVSNGCGNAMATTVITVNPLPSAGSITGTSTITTGGTTTLSDGVSGGVWSSFNTSVATVGSTGLVTGVSNGTSIISYGVTNGCGTAYATLEVTVSCPVSGGIISTIAGLGSSGYSGDGGNATIAKLNQPQGVAVDASGNIYIADYNNHRIRKVSTTGIITTIAGTGTGGYNGDGVATNAQLNTPWGIKVDISGNVIFADYANSRLRKITPGGMLTTIVGTGTSGFSGDGGQATAAQVSGFNVYDLAIDGSGNIYFPDGSRIRKINTSGIISTIAGSGTTGFSGDGGAATAAIFGDASLGIAADVTGNIYVADYRNARIRKINTSGSISTVVGSTSGYSGDGGAATLAQISLPRGVAVDNSGNIYIGDGSNNVVRKVSSGIITTFSGNGTGGFSGDGGLANAAKMFSPEGIAIDASGNVFIADAGNQRIRVVRPSGFAPISGTMVICQGGTSLLTDTVTSGTWSSSNTSIATIGSTGMVTGVSAGTSIISYITPCGNAATVITVNPLPNAGTISGTSTITTGGTTTLSDGVSGGLWSSSNTSVATVGTTGLVTGVSNGTSIISYGVTNGCGTAYATLVVTVSCPVSGGIITTIAGNSTSGYSGDGGAATAATLGYTGGVAIDGSGTVYIADLGNNRIRKISTSGVISTIAGNGTISYSGDNGPATNAGLDPGGIALDDLGNIYITDRSNSRIRKVGPSGIITTIAGTGMSGYSGDGGLATNAQLSYDLGVAVDGSGMVYMADRSNNRIRKIDASGVITTIAGGGLGGDGGAATNASLSLPHGLTFDAAGNLYIAEYSSNRVRKVNISGIITTIAGTGSYGYSGDGGAATNASFRSPTGVAVDGAGTIYIADASNFRIRKISPSGVISTIAGNGSSGFSGDGGPASAAQLSDAWALGVDGSGSLYISDANNNSIRKLINANDVSAISGASSVCILSNFTLTNATTGGTWSSANTSVATIGSTGIVNGVSAGTSIISYITPCGNAATVITVNPLPSAGTITGASSVCVGATTSLTNSTFGGTWLSTNTSVATIGSNGSILGVTSGTTIISYTVTNSCGTAVTTKTMVVNPLPNAGTITGSSSVCVGNTIGLSDAASGGTWSSASANVSVSGSTITGVTAGTATISYTLTNACGSTSATTVITINSLPNTGAITGASTVCTGGSIGLSDAVAGGVWSSASANVSVSGSTITGVSAGTATISYTVNNGCGSAVATKVITIGIAPTVSIITGPTTLCVGSTITLFDTVSGGAWTSNNIAKATVNSTSGLVTGVTAGTANISYTVTNSCGSAVATQVVTVNPGAGAGVISGPTSVCVGANITLIDTNSGGVWVSGSANATVGSSTGVVSGVSAGTALISYVVTNSCGTAVATKVISINTIPSIATIGGATSVCVGANTTLTDATSSGLWTSVNQLIATVGSTTGIVHGVASGLVVISYSVSNSCGAASATQSMNINASPSVGAISGSSTVCTGNTITLTDTASGGVWSSSAIAKATVGSTGVVTGIAAGTATISYVINNGCGSATATKVIIINNSPSAGTITGAGTVGTFASIPLTDATTGGVWSSSTPAVATVGSTGIVTGVTPGTTIISYSVTNSCGTATATKTIVVTSSLASIVGASTVCPGGTTTLTDATPGGVWTSNNTSVATIGSLTGVVTGISTGTTIISYTVLGNTVTTVMSVSSSTPPISGVTSVCTGLTTALSNASGGGAWTSSNTAKATVDVLSGLVTGVSAGTAIISYSTSCGFATTVVTVNSSPAVITGTTSVCQGSTTTLADATAGGTWSSSNPAIASVGTTGKVSGVSGGTATISYTIGTGCSATAVVTVNSLFSNTGITKVCLGQTTVINNPAPGGLWNSSNTAVATVNCNLGIVKGVTTGTTIISYTLGSGCTSTIPVTVISLQPITGASGVCVAATTNLTNTSAGGAWISSDAAIATIDSFSGVVTGIAPGNALITYSFGTGCRVNKPITVLNLPSNTGANNVCLGATTTISNMVSGGTWSSSNTAVATVVSGSGLVTGVTSGTLIITYRFGSTCIATTPFTVNSLPAAVTVSGGGTFCNNATITASGGGGETIYFQGTTSNGTSTATPSTSQVVTSSGTYYFRAQSAAGCWGSQGSVTVLIPVITGPTTVCTGTTTTLGNTGGAGGRWSSSNTAVGSVNATTGVVAGLTAGTTTIYDTLPSGCVVSTPVTVGTAPTINGATVVCNGQTITLTNTAMGGTWSSSAPTIATVGSTGVVTGMAAGNRATITYALSATCRSTISVSVTASNPISVAGTGMVCVGQSITLANLNVGGTWSSSDGSIATVASGTGVVTGVSLGTTLISYTLPSGCITTATVNTKILSPITGPASVCVGQTITLFDTTDGGLWSTSAPTVATVGSLSGIVSGVAGNNYATLTYTLGSGCKATKLVSVNPLTPIAGYSGTMCQVCQGLTLTLTDLTTGGAWSSANTAIGSFSTGGIFNGVSAGIVTVSYTLPTGCITTIDAIVNPVAPIVGPSTVCLGQTIQLSESAGAGTWSSSAVTIATVGTTGVVKGMAANNSATITYTFCTGCKTTMVVSVNPLSVIAGATSVCQGLITTMTDATAGGTWSSSAPGVLNFASTNGNVTGVSAGTATISYILPTGCTSAMTMTVNPLSPIAGPNGVCYQKTIALTNLVPGGAWASAAAAIASVVASSGIVTGATAANNSTTITYTTSAGCKATKVVSVYALPSTPPTIGGPATVSISGATITLTNATTGGTWTSGNAARATVVPSTGVVTGVGLGTVIITYTVANAAGCTNQITKVITVGPIPPPHSITTKTVAINVDATLALNETVNGGIWSCNDCDGIANLNTETGTVTGIGQGRATITYTVNDDSGTLLSITKVVVNALTESAITLTKEGNVYLIPNPNKGTFTIKGNLSTAIDEEITIEVVDILGQTIYKGNAKSVEGKINEQVVLSNTLANGMYLLNLHSNAEHYVFHFVVER